MARVNRILRNLFKAGTGGVGVLGAALGLCGVCSGQVIRLNPQTQVARQQDVRLGDIALVTATDPKTTEELASTVIVTGVEHSETIKAETVLLALLAQHGAAAVAGNLQISGAAACEIRVQGSPETRQPLKPAAKEEAEGAIVLAKGGAATQPQPASAVASTRPATLNGVPATMPAGGDAPTLTSLILARVEHELNAGPDDVRVSFETLSPLLEQPLAAGRRWVCRTLTRVPLGTVQFEAQLVEGGKVIERLTVQTKVEKKQMVLVATAKLARGDLVTPDKMQLQEAWMDRRLPTLFASMGEALGLEAQKDVEIGSMLDQRDFKPLLMAHRNDTVNVIYIAGALEVQMSGQAMADARLKEAVEIRNPKTGERYTATMVAKGIAVAGGTLTEEQERKLREAR